MVRGGREEEWAKGRWEGGGVGGGRVRGRRSELRDGTERWKGGGGKEPEARKKRRKKTEYVMEE